MDEQASAYSIAQHRRNRALTPRLSPVYGLQEVHHLAWAQELSSVSLVRRADGSLVPGR